MKDDVARHPYPPGAGSGAAFFDRSPWMAFALLSAFYFLVTAVVSSFKLLWFDELITINIALLGSPAAIWNALSHAADPNPPLTDLAVLASSRLFGLHEYSFRLPAILGYWSGLLALFLYLKSRITPAWALVGTLICMGMGGFEWSFDSRSYAIFFGTTMWALLCWVRSVSPLPAASNRRLALAGIAVFLAMGLCANYFSVLAFVPIALGELTRTVQRGPASGANRWRTLHRAIDWPVWTALAIGAIPLLVFRGTIRYAIAFYEPYAWNKVYFGMSTLAYREMVEAMIYPLSFLFLGAAMLWLLGRLCLGCRARLLPRWLGRLAAAAPLASTPAKLPEVVAVLVLMLYPYLGWAVASVHGGMLSSRMVIPVCLGAAIAAACVGYRTLGGFPLAGPITLALFLLWFMVRESYIGYSYHEQKAALYDTYRALEAVDHASEPIVISDNMLVAPFFHYAPPELQRRIVYPIDIPDVLRYRRQASGEVNLWAGRNAYGFRILPLAAFQHDASTYLILASGDDWLVDALNEHHYRVDLLPIDTHAEPLNFIVSPVSRYKPYILRGHGDQFQQGDELPAAALPVPFSLEGELPQPGMGAKP